MVEMLGVLAIVGVLSVGGLYGYGVAMKKHKANELLHQASMLAAAISAQIMSGKDPTTLDTFADSNLGKFALDYDPTKTTFDLKISGLDGSVCSQLKKGGMVQNVDCNPDAKTASITYYKNLATDPAEGEKSPTGGSGSTKGNPGPSGDEAGTVCSGARPGNCSVCLKNYIDATSGEWFDSDALCTEPGQTCADGNCVTSAVDEPDPIDYENMCKCILLEEYDASVCGGEAPSAWMDCSTDADCLRFGTWDETQKKCKVNFCTNNGDCESDEFCYYDNVGFDDCHPLEKGSCMAKADAKGSFASGTTAEADGFIRSDETMNWFSAQNFCRSYGKNLVTFNQIGLGNVLPGTNYCEGYSGSAPCQNIDADGWLDIQSKFGSDFSVWTANIDSNCFAFSVKLNSSDAYVTPEPRCTDGTNPYALCR
jgi:type II secretory pathway pseudopilin PulG